MASIYADAADWLADQVETHLATSVTYYRGQAGVTLPALISNADQVLGDDTDAAVVSRARDFRVTAADLVINSDQITPAVGDTIRVPVGGGVFDVYEVTELGGEYHYRPADPYGVQLRIHGRYTGQIEP
jgi:hypothetical protein